jgi:hypothetical protein
VHASTRERRAAGVPEIRPDGADLLVHHRPVTVIDDASKVRVAFRVPCSRHIRVVTFADQRRSNPEYPFSALCRQKALSRAADRAGALVHHPLPHRRVAVQQPAGVVDENVDRPDPRAVRSSRWRR